MGMLKFVQRLATLPFSAGEVVRERSGNVSPLAGPGPLEEIVALIASHILLLQSERVE